MTEISKQNLNQILNRITLQNLFEIVLHEFPELSWEEIQEKLAQNPNMISKKSFVIKIIVNAVKNLPQDMIEDRVSKLDLYYIAQTETRTWNAFRLKEKIPNYNERSDKLENIKSALRRADLMADIKVLRFCGKFVIKAVKKVIRKNGGILRSAPIYLQFFQFHPYVFISKGKLNSDLISGIVKGLGYNKFSYCHLDGPNVQDLLTLLRNKDEFVDCPESIDGEPNLDPEMRICGNVTNYSQYAKRTKYAEQLYGSDPPHLQQIIVTVKNDTWNTYNNFEAMEGTPIDGMELTIRSTNVIELFKEMMAKGVFVTPVPSYVQNILSAGRNKIKINPLK